MTKAQTVPSGNGNGRKFAEKWSNEKTARVILLACSGWTSTEIARELADGTMAETIRTMLEKYGNPLGRKPSGIAVPISKPLVSKLIRMARKKGMGPEEFLARLVVVIIKDDLYDAIVDDEDKIDSGDIDTDSCDIGLKVKSDS